jgi:type II secretory pathway pseudopilin PulG
MVELVVVICVILVVSAIALPSVMRAWKSYELTSAATQIANTLKWTRSDAIKHNKTTNCIVQFANGALGEDVNGNLNLDPGEAQVALSGGLVLLASGEVPDPGTMGYASAPQVPTEPIGFDSRGAVVGANGQAVSVLYVGLDGAPEYGFRAVTLLPSGNTQVWTATPGGNWFSVY